MNILVVAAILIGYAPGEEPPQVLEPVGRLDHPEIREASGIVASRRRPGVFWVHNDSGNPPLLFAVRRDGSLIREYRVAAPNVDWEDIATDDDGHLYLGDIGNNGGRLPLRQIYRIEEPDPSRETTEPLPATLVAVYRFGPEGPFDAEGMVVRDGEALIVDKRTCSREATLYTLPLDGSATLLKPAIPQPRGILPGCVEPPTALDLSPDGNRLVVVSYAVTRIYLRASPDEDWNGRAIVRYQADGIEAAAWDGADVILAGEGRRVYRIPARVWADSAVPSNGPEMP